MRKVFLVSLAIAILSVIVFLVPGSLDMFSYSGQKFFQGQVWRLITFSFTHVSFSHLMENLVAIGIVSFLAFEFGLQGKEIVYYFLAVSIAIALAEGSIFPAMVIAGASLGIYSLLGGLSVKGSNFVPKYVLIPVLGLTVFISPLLGNSDFRQAGFHFAGFVSGIGAFYLSLRFRRKKRILTGGVSE